jgi:hypothetical protein
MLFYAYTTLTFEQVLEVSKDAEDAFESSDIMGVHISNLEERVSKLELVPPSKTLIELFQKLIVHAKK